MIKVTIYLQPKQFQETLFQIYQEPSKIKMTEIELKVKEDKLTPKE